MLDSTKIEPYASVILRLLREVVSTSDERDWTLLMDHQYAVQEYFNRIGLRVVINPIDGFAFIEQPNEDLNGVPIRLPRLTRMIPLGVGPTLLLVLLRERLDEFMSQPGDADVLILNRTEIASMMAPFLAERLDVRRQETSVRSAIKSLSDMGLIKRLSADYPDDFIVERIIKAKFRSVDIATLKDQLTQHIARLQIE